MNNAILFQPRGMPRNSPASRLCCDCGDRDPENGTYGPPKGRGLRQYPGGYRREDLAGLWYCGPCSRTVWTMWRDPEKVKRRRLWIWEEVARRAAFIAERDAVWLAERLARQQLTLPMRMAS